MAAGMADGRATVTEVADQDSGDESRVQLPVTVADAGVRVTLDR